MIQQVKKGFSLIEIMILFTVLAVLLAASLPLITKKSRPIPERRNSGVYRCIQTGSGLIEELYTGTRQVGESRSVDECTFRVPKSALFRVDMYSAGAGGTLAALMNANFNDFRSANFDSTSADYSDFVFKDINDEVVTDRNIPNNTNSLISDLSDKDIEDMFSGEYLIDSIYTGDAGRGGSVTNMLYNSPKYATCVAQQLRQNAEQSNLNAINNTWENQTEPTLKSEQEDAKQAFEDAKSEKETIAGYISSLQSLKAEKSAYEEIIDVVENTKTTANGYQILKDYATVTFNQGTYSGTSLPALFGNITNAINKAKADDKYDDMYGIAKSRRDDAYRAYLRANCESLPGDPSKYIYTKYKDNPEAANLADSVKYCLLIDKTYEEAVLDMHPTGGTAFRVEDFYNDYYKDAYYNYKTVLYNYTKSFVRDYSNGATEYTTSYYCTDDDRPCFFHSDDAIKTVKLAIINNNNSSILPIITDDDRQDEFKEYTMSNNSSETIPYYLYQIHSKANTLLTQTNTNICNKFKSAGLNYSEASYENIDSALDALAKMLAVATENATAKETAAETALNNYNKAHSNYEAEKKAQDDLISAIKTKLYDISNYGDDDVFDSYTDGQTFKQIQNYCQQVHDPYAKENPNSTGVQLGANSYKSKNGGAAGKGKYLRIQFPLTFRPIPGQTNYSIKQYLRNIQTRTPVHREAFYPMICEDKDGNSCTTYPNSDYDSSLYSTSLAGLSQSGRNYHSDRENSNYFKTDSNYKIVNTDDGKDLGVRETAPVITHPYVAWSVPTYVDGTPSYDERANYTNNPTSLPEGGKKAIVKVDETDKGEYTDKTLSGTKAEDIVNFGNKVFENKYAYTISEDGSGAGDGISFNTNSTQHHPIYDDNENIKAIIDNIIASDSTAADPLKRDLRIQINTELWSKNYRLGHGGTGGNHKSFIVGNLGDNCIFNIPEGGEVYIPGEGQSIEALEDALKVGMACYKGDKVVFERELDGGKYDTNYLHDDLIYFYWTRDVYNQGYFTAGPHTNNSPNWQPTSIWAKVYNSIMGGSNNYDLNQYNVGAPGSGTTLTDRCIEPKGKYETKLQYIEKYYSNNSIISAVRDSGDESKDFSYEYYGTYDGNLLGFSCYGLTEEEERQEYGAVTHTDDIEITEGTMHYDIKAGKGGGGAVVITW